VKRGRVKKKGERANFDNFDDADDVNDFDNFDNFDKLSQLKGDKRRVKPILGRTLSKHFFKVFNLRMKLL
jgi:hypothetical protein